LPIKTILPTFLLLVLFFCVSQAQTTNNNLAPSAPGRDAQWESAGKDDVGTSNTQLFVWHEGERREIKLDGEGKASFNVIVPLGDSTLVVAASTPDGATIFRRVSMRGV